MDTENLRNDVISLLSDLVDDEPIIERIIRLIDAIIRIWGVVVITTNVQSSDSNSPSFTIILFFITEKSVYDPPFGPTTSLLNSVDNEHALYFSPLKYQA